MGVQNGSENVSGSRGLGSVDIDNVDFNVSSSLSGRGSFLFFFFSEGFKSK